MRIKCLVCTDPDPDLKTLKKLTYEKRKLKKKNLLKSKENGDGPNLLKNFK